MTLPLNRSTRPDATTGEGIPPALRGVAISILAVLTTLGLGRLAMQRFDTPVRELAIRGTLRNVQPDEVRLAAAPLLEGSALFELDLDALRLAIEQLPWVARARVDRQWPARLAVQLTEREPFARWGESEALSTEGVVFAPGRIPLAETLPRLGGAPGREREVMTMYGQLADHLSETPLALTGLTQDARGEWVGLSATGVSLRFGRGNPVGQLPRLKGTVLPALSSRLDSVKSIDLRYSNGFAVSWRDASETLHRPDADAPHSPLAAPTPSLTGTAVEPGAVP